MFRKVDGDEWRGSEPPLKDEDGVWMGIQVRHLRFQSDETHRHRGALPHRRRQPQLREKERYQTTPGNPAGSVLGRGCYKTNHSFESHRNTAGLHQDRNDDGYVIKAKMWRKNIAFYSHIFPIVLSCS